MAPSFSAMSSCGLIVAFVASIVPEVSGNKKGLCHRGLAGADGEALRGAGAAWYHNWGMHASTEALHFHPGVHGRGDMHSLNTLPHDNVLFGFNEPNMNVGGGGSAMSVEEVVQDWPQVEAAAKNIGAQLIAPRLAWVDPVQWYDRFFAECHGCLDRVHGVAAHIYNCDLPSLQKFVGLFKKFGKPLWITEMACKGRSPADQCAYIREAFPYLDSESSVAGYAWFSHGESILSREGRLTEIGKCFAAHDGRRLSAPALV